MSNKALLASLKEQFPLLSEFHFYGSDQNTQEPLPPVIALMAAMTAPAIPGDTCVVLPSRRRIPAFTAILAALSAVLDTLPKPNKKCIQNSFLVSIQALLINDQMENVKGLLSLTRQKCLADRLHKAR